MILGLRSRPHPQHVPQHTTHSPLSRWFAGGWAALLVGVALVMLACGGSVSAVQSGNSSNPTATSSDSGGSGTGANPTSTTPPTSATPTATHGTGPTPTPVPFTVSGASVAASPASFNGQCTSTMTTNFTATINVPAHTNGGTVTYHWVRSDGGSGPAQTLHFNAGDTYHTASASWSFGAIYGNGSTYWEAVVVTAPNSVTSAHGNATLTCQNHVTSVSATVSPGAYSCGSSSVIFTFSGTINVSPSPGGTITYKWVRSDGALSSPQTVSVPAGATSVHVSTTWTLGLAAPSGTYWEQVSVSAPNSATSNKPSFTKSC